METNNLLNLYDKSISGDGALLAVANVCYSHIHCVQHSRAQLDTIQCDIIALAIK